VLYYLLLYNRKLTNTYAPPPWGQCTVQKELNHTKHGGSMSARHNRNSIPIKPNVNSHNNVIFIKTLSKSTSHRHKKSLRRYCLTFHCSVVMCWRKLRKNRRKNCAVFALTTSTTSAPPCLVSCLCRNGQHRTLPLRRQITILHNTKHCLKSLRNVCTG